MPLEFKKYLKEHVDITDEQFEVLSAKIKVKTLKKGTTLTTPGSDEEAGFFVSRGLLRSYVVDSKGREHILQFAPERWWIGDRGNLYLGRPATFFIDAIEDSRVAVIDGDFIEWGKEICPRLGQFDLYLLNHFIINLQQRITLLLAASAEERYLSFQQVYPDVLLRVPQQMVASYLGVTPQSLSRVKKEIATRGRG
ncbi:Crp/Fnr family transcriptional regulator [Flavihumibacter petaseus]|uniref:Cyclic nucleotide-binding domain-containing protein n=1 Tax=Flavihumibacter petaseus NBRC 106054 TaxID=1220578 RepID=A0A0E9N6X9_9BACT|nr:Crp/Fnr family transcriptional regulator [Flavihumibacter petaseus]GAO45451.1 hypothetical protein FPE01S_05_01460 [Flavihumibacter petaseus NBRC 106054]